MLPITIAIVLLLAILVFSYRQVIDAYPMGGGAYAVSRANLGAHVSLVAAASLVVDYTLTVAVSIAAGVASLQSAFPSLNGATIPLCLGILLFIMVLNLRGLGETARAFLLPTLLFIVGLLAIIAIGLIHPLGLNESQLGKSQLPTTGFKAVTFLLILKAFSAGCSALTGVEAIANGTPLFREPRTVRAKRTELLLGLILGAMLLGLAVLAKRWQIGPRTGQTVLSQIMAMSVGRGWAYYIISITITVVLALAANTSFGGLPVLASLVARDNYLPHLFTIRGDRQTFGNGIFVLTILAGALLIAVGGNTNTLIPLFAIGVFIGFTLSQAGLVVHWWRERPARWRRRAAINGFGAVITAIATMVFLISKFTEGAWVVVIAIPAFIWLFLRIHAYYERSAKELRFDEDPGRPEPKYTIVVVPVNRISRLTEHALSEAESLGQEVIAVTVILEGADEGAAAKAEHFFDHWDRWNCGIPLKVLHTEYASVVQPIVAFIDELRAEHPDDQLVVLIPIVRPEKVRYRILHNQLDLVLSAALRNRDDVVVARVTVPLERPDPSPSPSAEADRANASGRTQEPAKPDAWAQRPFHTGSRFSMKAVAPSLASSLPNTLGCHSAASTLARSRSVDAVRTICLVACSASGPFRAIRSARATAASSTSAGWTTWLIRPRDSARSASMESPVSVNSSATAKGIRVLMNTPPPAAKRPRLTSGTPKEAAGRCDHHIAAEQKLEAAGHGRGVRCSNDGDGDLPVGEADEAAHGVRVAAHAARTALGETAQVHAGAEGPVARPGEHHRTYLGILLGIEHGEADGRQQLGIQGIACLRPVQPQYLHRSPSLLDENRLGRCLRSSVRHQATTFLSRRSALASSPW